MRQCLGLSPLGDHHSSSDERLSPISPVHTLKTSLSTALYMWPGRLLKDRLCSGVGLKVKEQQPSCAIFLGISRQLEKFRVGLWTDIDAFGPLDGKRGTDRLIDFFRVDARAS